MYLTDHITLEMLHKPFLTGDINGDIISLY